MTKSKPTTPRRGGKKKKLAVVFDPAARQEFLGGFHKRKLQKKAFYKTKLDKKMAEEKHRIRAQAKKLQGSSSSHFILPEVEALLAAENPSVSNTESFDIGSKTVTITSLESIHRLPEKEESEDEKEEEVPEPDDNDTTNQPSSRFVARTLQNSDIYKKVQRLKQKSKKSRPKKNPHFTNSKDEPATGGKKTKGKKSQQANRKKRGKEPKSKKGKKKGK